MYDVIPDQTTLRARLLELDTAAVADAMDSLGICRALQGIKQRVPGYKIAGPAFTVQYGPIGEKGKEFRNAGNYIDDMAEGSVVVISNSGNTHCTNWGDILTTVATAKGLAGTVVDGSARDISYVREIGYPLFTRDVFMVSAKNRTEIKATQVPITIGTTLVNNGDWVFGDENGVLLIEAAQIEEVIRRAENVNRTEQLIIKAVASGIPLVEARRTYGYATPWEPQVERDDRETDFASYWLERVKFVDIHYHANPDTYKRRFEALEAGRAYKELGGLVVLKSHLGDTTSVATTCRSAHLPVLGSTGLNAIAGGVDTAVIARALAVHQTRPWSGRLIVDLPTVVETSHKSALKRHYSNASAEAFSQGVTRISDGEGTLTKEVLSLLDFCVDKDVVISTGHASRIELYALIDACEARNGIRLLLNQPANPISGMTASDLVELGDKDWLFVEQTALTYLLGYQDDADFFSVLNDVPNLIYSSDLGQTTQMTPADWRAASAKWWLAAGLDEERITEISLRTALRMLAP